MARPLRIEYPGAYYHVINRGLERRDIFKNNKDYEYFLLLLNKLSLKYNLIVHSYCLMTNHYHLYLETPNGNLSKIMRQLDGIYTQAFNHKYNRVGPLMQGRYKAVLIDKDSYSLELSRYIHLNPVRAKMVDSPEKYQWSSYGAFIKKAETPRFLQTAWLLSQFAGLQNKAIKLFKQFTCISLANGWTPEKDAYKGIILGSKEFVSQIQQAHISGKQDIEIPLLAKAQKEISVERLQEFAQKLTLNVKLRNKLIVFGLRNYSQLKLKQIAKIVEAPSYSAVVMMANRLSTEAQKNAQVKQLVTKITDFCAG